MGGANRYLDSYLLSMGIPCRYLAPDRIKDGIVALDSFTAGFLSDEALTALLKGSLLLEGEAAQILVERGYGDQIGIKAMIKKQTVVNAEQFTEEVREDGTPIRVPSRIPIGHWYATELFPSAHVRSEFLDPLGNRFPALFTFENSHGGRVAVYPAEKNLGSGFFTPHRLRLWKNLLSELDYTLPRLECHSYTLCAVKKGTKGERYFWIANLSADPIETVSIDGISVDCTLSLYETAIFEKKGRTILRIH
jgi:hypothetical protein